MSIKDLRKKDMAALHSALGDASDEYFKNVLNLRARRLEKTHLTAHSRRHIARIKTLINERLRSATPESTKS